MATQNSPEALKEQKTQILLHNVALGALVVCPIIAAMPPRKLDLYTASLVASSAIAGNYLFKERYGKTALQVGAGYVDTSAMIGTDGLPEKAKEMQARIREEKARLRGDTPTKEDPSKDKTILERVWMGNEKPDWKVERDRREKEALDEGRGYGGLIADQIWEVWNWGKDKNKDSESKSEQVTEPKEK
jgi:hypothetical protein